jgi:hypothetical protein
MEIWRHGNGDMDAWSHGHMDMDTFYEKKSRETENGSPGHLP